MIILIVFSFIVSVCTVSVTNVEEESRSMLKFLIEQGVDINATDDRGFSALICSIISASHNKKYQGYPFFLIENEANVHVTTRGGYNALHFATSKLFSVRLIELLLERGVDVNAEDTYRKSTPLKNAVENIEGEYKNNTLPVVKMLLEKGANANVENRYGATLLEYSWNHKNHEIAALLLMHGADWKDGRSMDILIKLLDKKDIAIPLMKSLIEKGFDVNTDKYHRSILQTSIDFSNCELAVFLINNGAEMKEHVDKLFLQAAGIKDCIPLMKLLLEKGADINANDGMGKTAFLLSLGSDQYENAKFLLANGANVTARSYWGTTALISLTDRIP